jgi:hypothetical protein
MDFLQMLYGLSLGESNRGEIVGRTVVGEYTVDTCDTIDAGYETGVWRNSGDVIVVEYYTDENEASVGHEKWCDFVKNNPLEVYSVQTEENEKF